MSAGIPCAQCLSGERVRSKWLCNVNVNVESRDRDETVDETDRRHFHSLAPPQPCGYKKARRWALSR